MRTILKIILYYAILLFAVVDSAFGQPPVSNPAVADTTARIVILFRFDRSEIDRGFMNNAESLDALHDIMSRRTVVSELDSIVVTGYSSPDGNPAYNRILAQRRANAIMDFISGNYPDVNRSVCRVYPHDGYWDGLIESVGKDKNVPARGDLLKMIKDPGLSDYAKAQRIDTMQDGKTLAYLRSSYILRRLRQGSVMVTFRMSSQESQQEVKQAPAPELTSESGSASGLNPELRPEHELKPEVELQPEQISQPGPEMKSDIEQELLSEPKLEPESTPESEPESGLKPELQLEAKPEPEPKPESKTELKSDIEQELRSEPKPEPESTSESEPESGLKPELQLEAKPEPESKPESKTELKSDIEQELRSEPEPESKWLPATELNRQQELELVPESGPRPKLESEPKLESTSNLVSELETESASELRQEQGLKSELKPEREPLSEPELKSQPEPELGQESEAEFRSGQEPESGLKPELQPEAQPEPESKPESKTELKSEPESGLKPEPEQELRSEPKPEPELTPESEPESGLKPELQPEAQPEPESKPESKTELKSDIEQELRSEPKPEPESTSESEPESGLKPELQLEAKPEPEPEPESQTEPMQGFIPKARTADPRHRTSLALRTNLLLDLLGGPNVGVELPLGDHFSAAGDFAYAYIRIRNLYALQTIQGTLEARYWFKQRKNVLTGWNLGIYGTYCGRFDVQLGYGYQGDGYWSCGLTGGYSVPVAKRLNLDFSVAGGFLYLPEIREYSKPQDGHLIWEKTIYNASRIALTQVRVNLVWLINTKVK